MRAHDVISVALTASGMSQAQLAERCGLSTKHVNQFMRGKVPVSARVAILLDQVLGLDPIALVALELNAEIERAREHAPAPSARGQANETEEQERG